MADASPDPVPPSQGPVVVVAGPTGGGKTELSLALAERFDGEIVNADSMQVYRHLDIGTAKPTPEQRARVPHHLFDIVTPDVEYHAARYARDAHAALAGILARGHLPLLTGGTGLYIRAVLQGLAEEAGGADPELRTRLEREHARAQQEGDPERLHRRLASLDPAAARRIHPHDVRRTVRALEIIDRTGRTQSQLHADHAFRERRYRTLYLVVDPGREALRARIDARCEAMIERGLLQEVRGLRALGYGPELRPLQAIGYRHMHPVVDGSDTLAHALEVMRRDTHRFARRQRTWFRSVEGAEWVDPSDRAAIEKRVEAFLEGARAPVEGDAG